MSKQRSQDDKEHRFSTWQKACKILEVFCCPPCPPCIVSKLAFHPPDPPSYTVRPIVDNQAPDPELKKLRMFLQEGDREVPEILVLVKIRSCLCRTRRIAVVFWQLPQPSELLILHSHVNGADLGCLYEYMVYLRDKLKCEILSYDYCGYGASSGTASEANILKAGVAVMHYVTQTLNKPPQKVILYGQSIGSVPTTYLAAKYNVAGVIIHSGLYSGLRLMLNSKRNKALFKCVDPFRNVDHISDIRSPVLFIHGTRDRVIPVAHAMDLYRLCKTAVQPLWIEGGGHTGLEARHSFFKRLQEFIDFVKNREGPLEGAGVSNSDRMQLVPTRKYLSW